MKQLFSKKGFTLIEIIVSLAIFSIISVGFYSLFTTVFINTYKTSEITEATFLAQRELEDEISSTKEKIINDEAIEDYDLLDFTLFEGSQSRTVSGYHLVHSGSGNVLLESLVSETRPPELSVPTLNPFTIAAFYIDNGITTKAKYPTIDMNSLTIDIEGSLSTSNDGILISYLYYWYISDDVKYMPHEEPVFPDNYALIPGKTTRTLSELPEEFKGRYVKLVVTPVGEKGRMGESVQSNTIYVSQFDKTENLIMRLDGSYINPDDSDQVYLSGLNSYINRWLAVYPEDMRNSTSSSSRPLLSRSIITSDTSSNTISSVTSSDASTKFVVTGTNSNINYKTNVSAYLTMKLTNVLSNDITIIQAGSTSGYDSWELQYSNNQLILKRFIWYNQQSISIPVGDFKNDNWLFIKLDVWNDRIAIDINGTAYAEQLYNTTRTFNTTPMRINVNNQIHIGDVVVYEARHTQTDRDEVFGYFDDKYYPE